jgi:hypothetical protein
VKGGQGGGLAHTSGEVVPTQEYPHSVNVISVFWHSKNELYTEICLLSIKMYQNYVLLTKKSYWFGKMKEFPDFSTLFKSNLFNKVFSAEQDTGYV